MITLIGTLIGMVGGFLPELFKWLKAKDDRKHELAVLTLQMEAQKALHGQRLEEIQVQADVRQEEINLQASRPEYLEYVGTKWVDIPVGIANVVLALASGLVRPTITYLYFAAYGAVKYAQYLILDGEVQNTAQTIVKLWTEDDMAVFATVVMFWFSGRLFQRASGKLNGTGVPPLSGKIVPSL